MSETMAKGLKWLIVLTIPFFLAAVCITLVIGPWFPHWEYGKDDFPPDPYGFTQEQRTELALVAVDFLDRRGSADDTIYLLEEQTLPDSDEPLYNEREIKHMVDVKNLTDIIRRGITVLGILWVASAVLLLYRSETAHLAYRGIFQGGLATIIILVSIGIFMAAAWNVFFVQFHELLFPPGSWTFSYSDSLIRLFPERLWQDVGAVIVGATFGAAILTTLLGYWLVKREPANSG